MLPDIAADRPIHGFITTDTFSTLHDGIEVADARLLLVVAAALAFCFSPARAALFSLMPPPPCFSLSFSERHASAAASAFRFR